MGRPRKEGAYRYTLSLKLNFEQDLLIKTLAKEMSITPSEAVRRLIDYAASIDPIVGKRIIEETKRRQEYIEKE